MAKRVQVSMFNSDQDTNHTIRLKSVPTVMDSWTLALVLVLVAESLNLYQTGACCS